MYNCIMMLKHDKILTLHRRTSVALSMLGHASRMQTGGSCCASALCGVPIEALGQTC